MQAVIPGRSNRRVKIEHDRLLRKQPNRTIVPRQDQLAAVFMGVVHIATTRYGLTFIHAIQ